MRMTKAQQVVYDGAVAAEQWAVAAQVLAEARLNPPAPQRRPRWKPKGILAVALNRN